jgi:hypothetical protein
VMMNWIEHIFDWLSTSDVCSLRCERTLTENFFSQRSKKKLRRKWKILEKFQRPVGEFSLGFVVNVTELQWNFSGYEEFLFLDAS